MLNKAFATATRQMIARPSALMPLAARGVYTADTKPYVFINEHTKVLVQGMTGKHVSMGSVCALRSSPNLSWLLDHFLKLIELFLIRELSTPSNPLPTALRLSEVLTLARRVHNISVFQSSAT